MQAFMLFVDSARSAEILADSEWPFGMWPAMARGKDEETIMFLGGVSWDWTEQQVMASFNFELGVTCNSILIFTFQLEFDISSASNSDPIFEI